MISLITIYSSTHSSEHHESLYSISDFLVESLKVSKKLAKRITYLPTQFCSKHLTHFTNLNSFDIEKICSRNTAKNLSHFTNFPANVWLVSQKQWHCTISRRPRSDFSKKFESKCLYISVYLPKKVFVSET